MSDSAFYSIFENLRTVYDFIKALIRIQSVSHSFDRLEICSYHFYSISCSSTMLSEQ